MCPKHLSCYAFLALFTLLSSNLVSAQTFSRGSTDLSANISPDILGPNGDNVRLDVALGYYLREDTVLRLKLLHHVMEDIAPNENDYKSRAAGFSIERSFLPASQWPPYVGLSLAYRNTLFNDITESAPTYGIILGVKYFLTDTVAIDLGVSYETSSKDIFIVDFENKAQYVSPGIGLRVFLH